MATKPDIDLKIQSNQVLEDASENKIQLEIQGQTYYLEPDRENHGNQQQTLRWFLVPALIATVIFFGFFYFSDHLLIPLSGRVSIASLIIVIGLVSSLVTFALYFAWGKKKSFPNLEKVYWRNFPTIMISFAIILLVAMLFVFWLLGGLFEGMVLDIFLASLLAFLFFAFMHYVIINFILIISSSLITKLLITVISSGALIAMITNSEAQWWLDNISFLGTSEATNAWQFNLTLILGAFLLLALVDYLFVNLKEQFPDHRGLTVLRVLLSILAISLGLVGYFPSDGPGRSPELHEDAATMLFFMVLAIIIGIKWLVPKLSRELQTTSYAVGIILAIVAYLYVNGDYITLAGFEIVAVFLVFSWILLLFQNLDTLSQPPVPRYSVRVNYQEKTAN